MSANLSEDNLTKLAPEPLVFDVDSERSAHLNEIKQHKSPFLIPTLLKLQKYSSVPFTAFAIMHTSAVVIAPALSVDIAEQLLTMTRTIYQAPGLETALIWGSLSIHVLSGILIRLIQTYKKSQTGPQNPRPKPNLIDDRRDIKLAPEYGLGGITSILGLGAKKSFVSKKIGLSPLAFSGYVLATMVAGHVFRERLVPLMLDGDSSFINFAYLSHLLNKHKLGIINYIGYTLLVIVASYHIIGGWTRYLGYFGRKSRRLAYLAIGGLTAAVICSLRNISQLGPAFGFIAKKFDTYISYL